MSSTQQEQQQQQQEPQQLQQRKEIPKNVIPLPSAYYGLPKDPTAVKCPSCGKTTISKVHKELSTQWQRCVKCFLCCCLCCCRSRVCIELEEENCDYNHYCGHCGCFLGRYDPSFGKLECCEIPTTRDDNQI